MGGAVGAYGSFYDTTNQTTTANTPTAVTLNTTAGNNGVTLISASQWQFTNAGTYSITYSIQFTNHSTALGNTQVWLKKNGTNVADSNTHFDVPDKQGSAYSSEVLTVNYVLDVTAGDVYQLFWDTTNANVYIETLVGNGTYPLTPSVILTATQVMYTQSGYSGASGYSGYSGFSGSGVSGYSGASGISGYSGISGGTGSNGASGISGYSGYSGAVGTSGYSGFSGISGTNGSNGASGISGYSGASGISGYSGTNGASGISGYSGYSGSGISGYSGYSGIGTSGYSGYSGYSGTATGVIYDSFTATASQTTFTTSLSYTSGKISVYVNGVRMVNGTDVTVTSGTSIVFGTGLAVGTRVDAVYPR